MKRIALASCESSSCRVVLEIYVDYEFVKRNIVLRNMCFLSGEVVACLLRSRSFQFVSSLSPVCLFQSSYCC